MRFSLVVCTYMRPESLLKLLKSVANQSVYPNEILIIDGSTNDKTNIALKKNSFQNLRYFKVNDKNRGITKQRNLGIKKTAKTNNIICFLDDDVILNPSYFSYLINTYKNDSSILGVGGYITNEIKWRKIDSKNGVAKDEYEIDSYARKMGKRFLLRKRLGLLPDMPPGIIPPFSNGFSINFLPPSGEVYEVEKFMGCAMSFRREVFDKIEFSNYFEGYGLYEDADFSLRVSKLGSIYVNTAAQLDHFHEDGGRPNKFNYGKMVIRNGWYVWRISNPNPSLNARLKWNLIALLLTLIKFSNIFTSTKKKEALTEALGRTFAWFQLLISKPK